MLKHSFIAKDLIVKSKTNDFISMLLTFILNLNFYADLKFE